MDSLEPTIATRLTGEIAVATLLLQGGHFDAAETRLREVLRRFPDQPQALTYTGICRLHAGDPSGAVTLLEHAVKMTPGEALAWANLGAAQLQAGCADDAARALERTLLLKPEMPGVAGMRADALAAASRHTEAVAAYDLALHYSPDAFELHNNRGNALRELGKPADALAAFERARALAPGHAAPHSNCASALLALQRPLEALASGRQAIDRQPDYSQAWYNCGNALMDLGQLPDAAEHFMRALALNPEYCAALHNLGITLQLLNRPAEAGLHFDRLIDVNPAYPYALGHLAASRLHCCDWPALAPLLPRLRQGIVEDQPVCDPFTLLALFDDAALQRRCASQYSEREYAAVDVANPPVPALRMEGADRRLRIAYVSADLHDHATARLTAELFEAHDRSRFEVTAVSLGPDDGSAMRARLHSAFEHFLDARSIDDDALARRLRSAGIDIAVDLKGHTSGSRPGIFMRRCAPIQVSFLGYPGTSGALHIDYLIADRIVIPERLRQHYREQIVYMPESYQVNDGQRPRVFSAASRLDAGLPQDAFVYCCFNNSYKILPLMFDRWMRILQRVPDSVLWLLDDNPTATANLRVAALERGIPPGRLVFAPRVALSDHLSRHRLADLFLDTLPYNAHTTASDALWAGLPVLTCLGEAFAGRVAASLLHAVGLPELAVHTLDEYETLAVKCATDRSWLHGLTEQLRRDPTRLPLFDSKRFCRHLESALITMSELRLAGDSAKDIYVPAVSPTQNDIGA